MYDEQIMIQKTTLEVCPQIRNLIDKNMSPSFVGLYKICFELEQTLSEPKHLPSKSIQIDLMRLAYCWINHYSYFDMSKYTFKNLDTTCTDITQLFQNWACVSQKLMEDLIKIFGHADSLWNIMDREEIKKAKAYTNQVIGLKIQGFTSHNIHPCNGTWGNYSNTFCPFTTPIKDICNITNTDRNNSPVVYVFDPQDIISVYRSRSVHNMGSNTKNSVYGQNNSVIICRNDDPNCSNIGFPEA